MNVCGTPNGFQHLPVRYVAFKISNQLTAPIATQKAETWKSLLWSQFFRFLSLARIECLCPFSMVFSSTLLRLVIRYETFRTTTVMYAALYHDLDEEV